VVTVGGETAFNIQLRAPHAFKKTVVIRIIEKKLLNPALVERKWVFIGERPSDCQETLFYKL